MLESGTEVLISSRQDGCFIVDVKNPDKPVLLSCYNSIEMATGIAVSGKYGFICNRQYGVEIVDFEDPKNPKHVSYLRTEAEVQGCKCVNGILYCGIWSGCTIDVYDVHDLEHPALLSQCQLNGKGDGVSVYIQNGRTYAVAATGQHTKSMDSGYALLESGQGNGMEIFDVTDPKNPERCSVVKTDGRYYYASFDTWNTEVGVGPDGKVYAYLACTYNGLYAYDITNPRAPKRLAKIEIPIDKKSKNYDRKNFEYSGRDCFYPYDYRTEGRSPVENLTVADGIAYFGGSVTDLHYYENKDIFFDAPNPDKAEFETPKGTFYDLTEEQRMLPNVKLLKTEGQAYRIDSLNGKLYVAAGRAGILETDRSLNVLRTFETEDCVYDLRIKNGVLYTAEGTAGANAYEITENGLKNLWNYKSQSGLARSIEPSVTGKYVGLQVGATRFEIVNTETLMAVVSESAHVQMYHRNLLSFKDGRYLGAWGNKSTEFWYDLGENDENGLPLLVTKIHKTVNHMTGGGCDLGDVVLAGGQYGYYLYDPTSTGDTVTAPLVKPSSSVRGKPTVYGNILIMTDRVYGRINILNIEKRNEPKLIRTFYSQGCPDYAYTDGQKIYIPCGYEGVLMFDMIG